MKNNNKAKNKKYQEFNAHGEKLEDFLADKDSSFEKVELWIKYLSYVLYWYFKHPNQTFFVSHKTTIKYFKSCGCKCTLRGIQEAVRICKELNLINVEYADEKKSEAINKAKWVYRKITLNWKEIYKYFSCFDEDSKIFKALPSKDRHKKLIRKRPCSYIKNKRKIYEHYLKELGLRRYTSENTMFYDFVYTNSRKYYGTSNLTHDKIPAHLINIQERADSELIALADKLNQDKQVILKDIGLLEGMDRPPVKLDLKLRAFMQSIGLLKKA